MAWDAYAWFLLAGGVAGVGVGLLVFVLGPGRPANQILATVLVAQGAFPQGILAAWVHAGATTDWVTRATSSGTMLAIMALGFLHLLFIGQAIPHRSVAWLRTRAGAMAVILVWVVGIFLVFMPGAEIARMAVAQGMASTAALYSAIAAWLEMRSHAPGTAGRSRATTYFVAFVTRDLSLVLMTIILVTNQAVGVASVLFIVGRCMMLVSHLLIAAALLRGQVLGLNRKIVAGTSGALAAGLLAMAFVVVTELIEGLVSGGDTAVGIVAAVVLTLLFRPVQTVAERGLVRMFPSARPLSGMAEAERAAMYREQVELAWADGRVGAKERRMLDRMAVALSLQGDAALRIESTVATRPPPTTAAPG